MAQHPAVTARRVDAVFGWAAKGELSGPPDLAFDGPSILRMSAIEEVERMLLGNVGLALATRALNISSSILPRKEICI